MITDKRDQPRRVELLALHGRPEIAAGDDLAALIADLIEGDAGGATGSRCAALP